MKFRYLKFPLTEKSSIFGSSILKPIIPIEIFTDSYSIRFAALIDSGADFCIFDGEIGESLGLSITSGIKISFGGVQERGGATAYLHKVILSVGGHRHEIDCGFSYDIAKHGYGILGQRGFFDLFAVKFDLKKEQIELIPKRN